MKFTKCPIFLNTLSPPFRHTPFLAFSHLTCLPPPFFPSSALDLYADDAVDSVFSLQVSALLHTACNLSFRGLFRRMFLPIMPLLLCAKKSQL